jgi:PPP family 3-phenylpropionic acid transporter
MSISDSLIARMARRYQLNFGSMRLWGSFGFAASALLFGVVWQMLGFGWMFIVGSLFAIPLVWLTGKFEELPGSAKESRAPVIQLFRDTGLVMLLLATVLAGISNSLSMTFGGIYARWVGGGNFLVGLMIAAAAFPEILSMHFSQRIANRLRGPNAVILSYALMATAYLGYVLVPNPNALALFSILKGLGYGLWFPVTVRILTERTPDAWASTAQSLLAVGMFGLAPLAAGPLGGWIHDAFNPAAVFLLGIATLGLAAAVLWLAVLLKKLE